MKNDKTKGQRRGHFGEKANFIRSQPRSMSAKQVVEAAAKQGLKISVNHVYNLRMGAAAKLAGVIRRSLQNRPTSIERQIRDAIAELGLQRARDVFDDIAEVFRNW